MSYKIPIFLSYPRPYRKCQQTFIQDICNYLDTRGFTGRTLGVENKYYPVTGSFTRKRL